MQRDDETRGGTSAASATTVGHLQIAIPAASSDASRLNAIKPPKDTGVDARHAAGLEGGRRGMSGRAVSLFATEVVAIRILVV